MKKFVVTQHALGLHHELVLSEEQYDLVKVACNQLYEFVLLEERFDSVAGGFLDFEKAMLAEILEFAYVGFRDGLHQMSVRRKLNRLLMNALSAARGYIDHLPQTCNQLFGKEHIKTITCLNKLAENYDNILGYRMFEALRNHAQHCGFPIHSISYAHQVENESFQSRSRLTFSPIADINELAKNKKFKKSILEEMKALGQRIDLKPYLRDYVRGIARVHYKFRDLARPVANSSRQIIDDLVKRFAEESGVDQSLAVYALFSENGQIVDSVPLSNGVNSYLDYLIQNNKSLDQEGDFYIASAE